MKLNQLIEQLQEHARLFPQSAGAEVEIVIPELADLAVAESQWEPRTQRVVIVTE